MVKGNNKQKKASNTIDLNFDSQSEDLFVDKIVKKKLRMRIFLLLYLYPKLNVTEVSNKLNKSKATVSRHLKEMKKEGVLVSEEEKAAGKINPLYYSLPKSTLDNIKQSNNSDSQAIGISQLLLNPTQIVEDEYKKKIKSYKSIIKLLINGIELIIPIIENLETKLDDKLDLEKINELIRQQKIQKNLLPEKFRIDPVIISEERLEEANEIYDEFKEKLKLLREKGEKNSEQRSLLLLNSILPLKDLLEFNSENQ